MWVKMSRVTLSCKAESQLRLFLYLYIDITIIILHILQTYSVGVKSEASRSEVKLQNICFQLTSIDNHHISSPLCTHLTQQSGCSLTGPELARRFLTGRVGTSSLDSYREDNHVKPLFQWRFPLVVLKLWFPLYLSKTPQTGFIIAALSLTVE